MFSNVFFKKCLELSGTRHLFLNLFSTKQMLFAKMIDMALKDNPKPHVLPLFMTLPSGQLLVEAGKSTFAHSCNLVNL